MPPVSFSIDFNDDCCICLEVLRSDQCIITKPCNHVYHRKCITTLTRCALCRSGILQKDPIEIPALTKKTKPNFFWCWFSVYKEEFSMFLHEMEARKNQTAEWKQINKWLIDTMYRGKAPEYVLAQIKKEKPESFFGFLVDRISNWNLRYRYYIPDFDLM